MCNLSDHFGEHNHAQPLYYGEICQKLKERCTVSVKCVDILFIGKPHSVFFFSLHIYCNSFLSLLYTLTLSFCHSLLSFNPLLNIVIQREKRVTCFFSDM